MVPHIDKMLNELELVMKEIELFQEYEIKTGIKVKELPNMLNEEWLLRGDLKREIDKLKPKNGTAKF